MSERSVTYYAVTREREENWDAGLSMRQQEQWEEHAAFMDALADKPRNGWFTNPGSDDDR